MVFTRKDGIFMGYVSFREGNRCKEAFLVGTHKVGPENQLFLSFFLPYK